MCGLYLSISQHTHSQFLQPGLCGNGNFFGEAGQDAWTSLDQHDLELGCLAQRAVGFRALRQLHQLCCQLYAGRTCADDGDLQRFPFGHAAQHAQADFAVELIGLAA